VTAGLPVEVDGRVLQVSSLDRVLWPETGTTKAELLAYYLQVAPVLMPHVQGRPVTLHRFPQGVGGPHFFQTRTPPHPPWLRTVTLSYPRTGKVFDAPVLDDTAGLVWAVNLTTVELHPFLMTAERLDAPTAVVLDLDPGPPAGLVQACEVALLARDELEQRGLRAWPKSSGGKGLHLHVPVAGATWEQTKGLAHALARTLAARHPDLVVDRMTKALRAGKVLVDWSQNDPGKSTVAPWSARGWSRPTVAAPVTWDEVDSRDPRRLLTLLNGAGERLAAQGDLFAGLLTAEQSL
jgi:bifunctional non-homologous end joining protein LigD